MNDNDELGYLKIGPGIYKTRISKNFLTRKTYQPADPRMILSFIPGTVLDIMVKPGQLVFKGDDLMILDAMKMKNRLKCNMDGKVKNISVRKGDKVSKGTVMIELE